ncbi:hypothetical protein CYMTET_43578 [Cymbomonas tetramitiformis]|uniref:Uncharacterized protein n=1 Tax=Cymbomonas tetramitiformis TaxID=36881 RepID=A0AAE0F0H5_9CHLO|nr:hypothetical protein CYMTET_43578 [Cymbomonas tetramitiformis]
MEIITTKSKTIAFQEVKEVHAQQLTMESRISQLQSEVKKREQERDEVIEDLLVAQEECSMNADSIIRHSAASDNDDEDEGPVHQSEDILANLEAFDINFDTVFKEEKVAIERTGGA